jgi:hypothetical protein
MTSVLLFVAGTSFGATWGVIVASLCAASKRNGETHVEFDGEKFVDGLRRQPLAKIHLSRD